MAELRQYFIGFMVLGLFSIALIMFALGIQVNNNVSNSLYNDSRVSSAFLNLSASLDDASITTNKIKDKFQTDSGVTGLLGLVFYSIVDGAKLLLSMTVGVFVIIATLIIDVIGINPIVFTVISISLLISLILLSWRLYRLGQ